MIRRRRSNMGFFSFLQLFYNYIDTKYTRNIRMYVNNSLSYDILIWLLISIRTDRTTDTQFTYFKILNIISNFTQLNVI